MIRPKWPSCWETDEEDIPLYNFTGYEIAKIGDTNYIVYEYWLALSQGEIYCRQYHTVVAGEAIDIILKSYGQPIRDDVSSIYQGILDSVIFTAESTEQSSPRQSNNLYLLILAAFFQHRSDNAGSDKADQIEKITC